MECKNRITHGTNVCMVADWSRGDKHWPWQSARLIVVQCQYRFWQFRSERSGIIMRVEAKGHVELQTQSTAH